MIRLLCMVARSQRVRKIRASGHRYLYRAGSVGFSPRRGGYRSIYSSPIRALMAISGSSNAACRYLTAGEN